MLKALPLFLSKNREIVVVAVWLDNPCPANHIKIIPTNKKNKEQIFENIKQDADKMIITYDANFNILE